MTWNPTAIDEENSRKSQFLGIFRIAALIIIVVFSILLVIYFYENRRQKDSLIQELVQQEQAYLGIATLSVQQDIAKMANDLLTLADFTASSIDLTEHTHINDSLEELYLHMSENYGIYDQIRFIDEQGDEVIRVNYMDGDAELVSPDRLRNKKDRYYFQDSYLLSQGSVYFSPIDLNVEDGKIEVPYKPMIRIATPIIDEDGNRHGIVVLNYLADNLLEIINLVYKGYDSELMLLNEDGYFLINTLDRDMEFGFMFDDRRNENLSAINPDVYGRLEDNGGGWYLDEDYLYSYTRIYPFVDTWSDHSTYTVSGESAANRYWVILTQIPMTTIQSRLDGTNLSKAGFVLLSVLIVGSSILIAYLWYQKNIENLYIRNLAHFDQLTQCYNRAWGLRLLDDVISKARSKNGNVGLLFLDLDKFKEVNDTYGHKAGDAVLVHCAAEIKKVLGSDDFVIRLGGDEFLIVLPNIIGYSRATDKAKILQTKLKQPIIFESVQIYIDSSIGISVYPEDGHSLNDLVSSSDAAMYKAKQKKRGGYVESRSMVLS